ncbi:uncharacterized protein [Eurosta solidaginis]|uniref:uncharacterized protein n=1 Tax=Eurosta solidaginis TaxID=178769 RepID=UPI0035309B5A
MVFYSSQLIDNREYFSVLKPNSQHCNISEAHAVGKIPINTINIDLMSIFGHKLYGPKGIWALYIQSGSGQERGIRSGNVPVLIWSCIKRDLLAELYSDLSPKYIGFTTPPTGTGAAYNGSESDGGLQKEVHGAANCLYILQVQI